MLLIAALPFFASQHRALAGQWVIDQYEVETRARSSHHFRNSQGLPDVLRFSEGGGIDPFVNPPRFKIFNVRNSGIYEMSAALLRYRGWNIHLPGDTGYITVTITPVFKWVGNEPPSKKLYLAERSMIYITRSYFPTGADQPHSAANPYKGGGFALDEAENGFNDPIFGWPTLPDGYTVDRNVQTDGVSKVHVNYVSTNGSSTYKGPSRQLTVRATSGGWSFGNDSQQQGSASLQAFFFYEATASVFNLDVKRRGSNNDFNIDTSVAAGGYPSDVHDADVRLTAKAPLRSLGTVPLSNQKIPIDPPNVFYGEKAAKTNAKYTSSGVQTTDSNGQMIIGDLRSSDKIKWFNPIDPTSRVRLMLDLGLGSYSNPSAYLTQFWGAVEWRMGEQGEKIWKPKFSLNKGDYSEWVWTRVTFGGLPPLLQGTPIAGHEMRLFVEHMVVRVWDPQTQSSTEIVFTSDPQETASLPMPGADTARRVVCSEDLTSLVQPYIILPGTLAGSEDGVYKGPITLPYNPNHVVDSFRLSLRDMGVFRPKLQQ